MISRMVVTMIVIFLVAGGVFFREKNKVQAISMQIHVKDLPEEGVRIIAPYDLSFDKRVGSFLKGPSSFVDRVKPFSVIIENSGERAIVGSRIIYEIMKSDGTVYRHYIGAANPKTFAGGDRAIQTTTGAAIPPHGTRFVSLVGSAAEGENVQLDNIELSFRGPQDETEAWRQSLNQGNREEAFNKSADAKMMAEAVSVTVSIDGIFFEDGTFVGDNKTGLFEEIKAYADAEYDLVMEISAAQTQGKAPDEVIAQVTEGLIPAARTEKGLLLRNSRESNPYQKYKAWAARTLLNAKERFGAKEAIRQSLELLKKPRIELRKK